MISIKMPNSALIEHSIFANEINKKIDSLMFILNHFSDPENFSIDKSQILGDSDKEFYVKVLSKLKKPFSKSKVRKIDLDLDKSPLKFWNDVKTKVTDLLISPSSELVKLHLDFEQFPEYRDACSVIKRKSCNQKLRDLIEYIFDYESFYNCSSNRNWDAYAYCEMLELTACPYCNRSFIGVIRGGTKWRPQLDHFYPKNKFLLLRLSIQNLVPSCPQCNVSKSDTVINSPELNPFEEINHIKFCAHYSVANLSLPSSNIPFQIEKLDGNPIDGEILKFYTKLGILDAYKVHGDEVAEIVAAKFLIYNNRNLIKQFNLPKDWVKRIFLKTDDGQFLHKRRPLTKLRNDIADEIGLIFDIENLLL